MKKTLLFLVFALMAALVAPSALAAGTYADLADCSKLSDFTAHAGDAAKLENDGSSLKISFPEPYERWGRVEVAASSDTSGYDGLVLRVRTTEPNGGIVLAVGTADDTCRYPSPVVLDKSGNAVEYVKSDDHSGLWIPAEFDGYLFFPFANATTTHDATSKDIMLLFVNTGDLAGYDLLIDSIGAYKGTDYAAVITDMGGTVSVTSSAPAETSSEAASKITSTASRTSRPSTTSLIDASEDEGGISPVWFIAGGIVLVVVAAVVVIIVIKRRGAKKA